MWSYFLALDNKTYSIRQNCKEVTMKDPGYFLLVLLLVFGRFTARVIARLKQSCRSDRNRSPTSVRSPLYIYHILVLGLPAPLFFCSFHSNIVLILYKFIHYLLEVSLGMQG
jgi:hypothetical protein